MDEDKNKRQKGSLLLASGIHLNPFLFSDIHLNYTIVCCALISFLLTAQLLLLVSSIHCFHDMREAFFQRIQSFLAYVYLQSSFSSCWKRSFEMSSLVTFIYTLYPFPVEFSYPIPSFLFIFPFTFYLFSFILSFALVDLLFFQFQFFLSVYLLYCPFCYFSSFLFA